MTTERENVKWPKPDRHCRCRGMGMREIAWHHTDEHGIPVVEVWAACCADCELGRLMSSTNAAPDHVSARSGYLNRPSTLSVILDPGPMETLPAGQRVAISRRNGETPTPDPVRAPQGKPEPSNGHRRAEDGYAPPGPADEVPV